MKVRDREAPAATDTVEEPTDFVRFSLSQRLEHVLMIVSFTALVVTGVPQKFLATGWAQTIILTLGGIESIRFVHRSFAIMFCLEALYHVAAVAISIARGRFTSSMFPGRKDVADALAYFRYCVGASADQPRFDRFDYRQKFEYWGVVMGTAIMIATGLILLFPAQVTWVLPGTFVPASKEMHGGEALLAFLVIVIWHLYGTHLNPQRFPGDTTIFSGRISRERMIEEHPLDYVRLTGQPLPDEEAGAPEQRRADPQVTVPVGSLGQAETTASEP